MLSSAVPFSDMAGHQLRPRQAIKRTLTIRKQVSETVPTTSINLDDLRKRVELFRAGQVRHHLLFLGIID